MFCATMPLYSSTQISANIWLSHPRCFRNDKLAAFRILWEKWVACLPLLVNPGVDMCVDKQLVAFKGHCGLQSPLLHACKLCLLASSEQMFLSCMTCCIKIIFFEKRKKKTNQMTQFHYTFLYYFSLIIIIIFFTDNQRAISKPSDTIKNV